MNNQNRPKANYHLLATVATLGLVRGGGYVRIKVFELGAKRRKGSGESGPQCPHRGLSRSDWGGEKKCARSAKRRKGSGESGPQCPPGGCHEVTGG